MLIEHPPARNLRGGIIAPARSRMGIARVARQCPRSQTGARKPGRNCVSGDATSLGQIRLGLPVYVFSLRLTLWFPAFQLLPPLQSLRDPLLVSERSRGVEHAAAQRIREVLLGQVG